MKNLNFKSLILSLITILFLGSGVYGQTDCILNDLPKELQDLIEERIKTDQLYVKNKSGKISSLDINESEIINYLQNVNNGYERAKNMSSKEKKAKIAEIENIISQAQKDERFLLTQSLISPNMTYNQFFDKLEANKEKFFAMENGANYYVMLNYTLQIAKSKAEKYNEKLSNFYSGPNGAEIILSKNLTIGCGVAVITATAGGAALGSSFGPVGAAVGGLAGFAVAIYEEC